MLHLLILSLSLTLGSLGVAAFVQAEESVLERLESFQKKRGESLSMNAQDTLESSKKRCVSRVGHILSKSDSLIENLQNIEHKGHTSPQDPPIKALVFVSSSMNVCDLKNLVKDAPSHQAAVVMRGLIEGSVQKTMFFIQSLEGSVKIDPRLFQAFSVTSVPTFVSLHEPLVIRGGTPTIETPSHDIVRGNLTLQGALSIMEGKLP